MYKLIENGKVIYQSARKIDAIYEHQKYSRRQRVKLVGPKLDKPKGRLKH